MTAFADDRRLKQVSGLPPLMAVTMMVAMTMH
jgi:hypothetical protein